MSESYPIIPGFVRKLENSCQGWGLLVDSLAASAPSVLSMLVHRFESGWERQ
jgi:hypothetical protein